MCIVVCLEKGSDMLSLTLYTLSIYPSVHNQLIRTLFEAHIVCKDRFISLIYKQKKFESKKDKQTPAKIEFKIETLENVEIEPLGLG